LRVTAPGSFTYSGSSGMRMLKRHLQHTCDRLALLLERFGPEDDCTDVRAARAML